MRSLDERPTPPQGRRIALLRAGAATLVLLLTASAVRAQLDSSALRRRVERGAQAGNIDEDIRKLESEEASERLNAVKGLGASGDNKALDYLIQAVGDEDVRVRVKAVEMLGEMRAGEATPVLVQQLLLRGTEPQMKQRILAALGEIGDARAARPILEFLKRDLDPATRGTAIYALGDIGAPEAVETLENIADNDDNPRIRRVAGDALNKVRYHEAERLKEVRAPAQTFLERDQPPQQ
jgi:HEAT repeat protein